MMSDNKQSTQFRFLLAATLSMAVLFGWTYFFPTKKTEQTNTNTAQTIANKAVTATPEVTQNQPAQQPTSAWVADSTPNKSITINTPLYQIKLDNKGAVATSWVLLKNKSPKGEKFLFADGSTENDKKPLELIAPESLNRSPRELSLIHI